MKTSQKEIKQARLVNNCPECFSKDSLILTFYQKNVRSLFFKQETAEITDSMVCEKCKTTIYPVRWTDDIERVHEFYAKTVQPRKSFKLTIAAYLLIVLVLAAVAFAVYMSKNGTLF